MLLQIKKLYGMNKWVKISILFFLALLVIWFEYQYLPMGIDWVESFRPATLEFLAGHSPYSVTGFFNPPWTLIPFIPLALIPIKISNLILFDLGLASFVFILGKLKVRPLIALVFLFFPTTLMVLFTGNLEWLVMLGLVLPPQIGLFFILIKPQVGIAMAIYWLITTPKKVKTFLPVVIAFLVSFAIYQDWILKLIIRGNKSGYYGTFDISFFPYLVPLGLALLFVSIRKHKDSYAYMASPFLAPYIGAISYSIVVLGIGKLWSEHLNALPKGKVDKKGPIKEVI